jgi:starch synthase (maltosyl-transferring)
VVGESVRVEAIVFTDGHDQVVTHLLYRASSQLDWQRVPMQFLGNDIWESSFTVSAIGEYDYTVEAAIDPILTWKKGFEKRLAVGEDMTIELLIGADLIDLAATRAAAKDAKKIKALATALRSAAKTPTLNFTFDESLIELIGKHLDGSLHSQHPILKVAVDPPKAGFSTWIELFPRSFGSKPFEHGTFKSCERLLPEIAKMGFDVLYLPPIHPIGLTKRKGKNNAVVAALGEPGSCWAIGAKEGGHQSIHPELGTMKDFEKFVKVARSYHIDIALDIAFQCSPDHPYVKTHPEWFSWRPDGTVQFAENPPKKYEDVLPFNFETKAWQSLWEELKSVFEFWITKGVTIFRVDNPHTKSFAFWEWCLADLKKNHPETIFLAEAFTRPHVMYRLAKLGFTQSYTYFTWRNSKSELQKYLTELTTTEVKEFFRPNFWPNTPDILSEPFLQQAPRAAFILRYILAATLCSNIGIYEPAYSQCLNTPFIKGKEEYMDSEKYELKSWDWNAAGNISELIARVNAIRHQNLALQQTSKILFTAVETSPQKESEHLIAFLKTSVDGSNRVLTIVSHDATEIRSGWVRVPLTELGLEPDQRYVMRDLLSGEEFVWNGEWNFVQLNPRIMPAHIFRFEHAI